jgi:hypothetical protein
MGKSAMSNEEGKNGASGKSDADICAICFPFLIFINPIAGFLIEETAIRLSPTILICPCPFRKKSFSCTLIESDMTKSINCGNSELTCFGLHEIATARKTEIKRLSFIRE